jgi:dephospho-CoA kinase
MSNAARNTADRDRDRKAIARTKPPCGICAQPIDYTLRSPDPMSYEVDHITALANGGTDHLDNKQASHRKCNRTKWHTVEREVVLICGPPGAGKSTLAHTLGLAVFDVDDAQWDNNEPLFRAALEQVAKKADARAAVIRSAATMSARQAAANLCGATSVIILETDAKTCTERITQRGRTNKQSIRAQIAAAQDWWRKYEPGQPTLATSGSTAGTQATRSFVTARSW